MSDFAVNVVEITQPVEHHPDADRLSLIRIGGYVCISAKLEDGSHRYKQGDLVVYVPEGAVVPEYLLKPGFWDEKNNKGILAGKNGDRVKAKKLRGVFSQGILFPVETNYPDGLPYGRGYLTNDKGEEHFVNAGTDVAAFLGITKYEPPIPASMAGEVANMFGAPVKYDFESIQKVTDLFEEGEMVEATEKLHGTFVQIGYIPGLNHPEAFLDGNVYVASKGLGAQGLAFKNNEANAGNVYVRTLRALLSNEEAVAYLKGFAMGEADGFSRVSGPAPVRLFGEIFGQGIQDLNYGSKTPTLRLFDIMVGTDFLPPVLVEHVAKKLGLERVPSLYTGLFDLKALEAVRDGKDTLSGSHVREGIVIRSIHEKAHPLHGRKIGKWVSPDYLLRANGTELQ